MSILSNFYRIAFTLGFLSLAVSAIWASLADAPEWFGEAVRKASLCSALALAVLWILSEAACKFVRLRGVRTLVTFVAIGAASTSLLYVGGAAFLGLDNASHDTWHLLPLFALMHQIKSVLLFSVLGTITVAVVALVRIGRQKFSVR